MPLVLLSRLAVWRVSCSLLLCAGGFLLCLEGLLPGLRLFYKS
jgi:hypothetical protein